MDAGGIRTVVLTHLHWDHCYGLPQPPNARVLVQDREIRYGVYPDPNDYRRKRKYELSRGAPFLRELRRMEEVDGAAQVAPGVRIIPTPGRSPGHQSVLIAAEELDVAVLPGHDPLGLRQAVCR